MHLLNTYYIHTDLYMPTYTLKHVYIPICTLITYISLFFLILFFNTPPPPSTQDTDMIMLGTAGFYFLHFPHSSGFNVIKKD